jgi:putative ATPase
MPDLYSNVANIYYIKGEFDLAISNYQTAITLNPNPSWTSVIAQTMGFVYQENKSDPDAAIYYLGRLLAAGDLPSACRRLLICANEDVGLAYPHIIPIVKAAVDTALMVGMPEARLALANAVILVATAPKSNSAHDAINAAMADIEKGLIGDIPRHLQNKHCDGYGAEKGQHYLYPHDYPRHYVKQQYLPDVVKNKTYYHFGNNSTEQKYNEYWKNIKK